MPQLSRRSWPQAQRKYLRWTQFYFLSRAHTPATFLGPPVYLPFLCTRPALEIIVIQQKNVASLKYFKYISLDLMRLVRRGLNK